MKNCTLQCHNVNHLVYTVSSHDEHDITIDDLLKVVEDKIRRGDNDDIAHHDDATERDITILVHDGCNNIRATCVTIES